MGLQRQVSYQVVDQRQIMRERQLLVDELAEWGVSDSEAVKMLEMNNWQRVLSMDSLDKIRAELAVNPHPAPLPPCPHSLTVSSSRSPMIMFDVVPADAPGE